MEYIIEENKYHGVIVYDKETRGFGDPLMLTYWGATNGDPNRFKINSFIRQTELIASCSNLTCYFKTKEKALEALDMLEGTH